MSINQTLIGQMITFALFVWFTMRFVWPLLEKTLQERQAKIAEGLLAAEQGHQTLSEAKAQKTELLQETKQQINTMIDNAKKHAADIIEEAKAQANRERKEILEATRQEVEREWSVAHQTLQQELITLTVESTEKLLGRVLTETDRQTLAKLSPGEA